MANLKKDSTYKKSSTEGIQAAGGSRKPKAINKQIAKAITNNGKAGKKI
jgi:hypothetical protein